jgi:hypothetical protein
MSVVWDRAYQSDNTFFGEERSSFATLCYSYVKSNNAKNVLEIPAGHGIEIMFDSFNSKIKINEINL